MSRITHRSATLNLGFSISKRGYLTNAKEPGLSYYLFIAEERRDEFAGSETKKASSRF